LHGLQPTYSARIEKVFADKGSAGEPNRQFLATNEITDGIMRKNTITVKFYPVK
jgi:hypothetical protein